MKRSYSLFVVVVSFSVSAALGQDFAFRVVVNQGKNEVKTDNGWTTLRVGEELKADREIRIGQNGYLGLVHNNGRPMQLREAGSYNVADLSAKIGGGNSVLNKYTEFILANNQERTNRLQATGAVHRGLNKIDVHLPSTAYVFGDTIVISWEKEEAIPGPYQVTFSSLWGDELMKIETAENNVYVNLRSQALAASNDILVEVRSRTVDKKSDQFILRKFSESDSDRIEAEYNAIANDLKENTVLNRIIQAAFFEQKKLLVDATTAFRRALELGPTMTSLWEDYENFLLRNGLKPPPEK